MLHEEKPELNEDLIEHYGVKGMHWGVRNRVTGGQIHTARRSVAKSRENVKNVREQVRLGKATEASLAKAKLAHLQNPDRVTAGRLTNGERVATLLLVSPAGLAGLELGTQLRSRYIGGRQVTDKYKPNKK